jgi:glycerol 2-dehydrogenase (NADP+)
VLPKSVSMERIEANFALECWELTIEEMGTLSGITKRFKVGSGGWLPARVFF